MEKQTEISIVTNIHQINEMILFVGFRDQTCNLLQANYIITITFEILQSVNITIAFENFQFITITITLASVTFHYNLSQIWVILLTVQIQKKKPVTS